MKNQEKKNNIPENFRKILRGVPFTYARLNSNFVEGKILKIDSNFTTVDLGLKVNGTYPLRLITPLKKKVNLNEIYKWQGQSVNFYLEEVENIHGEIDLNFKKIYRKINKEKRWEKIEALISKLKQRQSSQRQEKLIKGRVLNTIKGGFSVGIGGIVAFLPESKLVAKRDLDISKTYINKTNFYMGPLLSFKIVKINPSRQNIILTRDFFSKKR